MDCDTSRQQGLCVGWWKKQNGWEEGWTGTAVSSLALAFAGCVAVGGSPLFNCRDKEAEEGSSTSFAKSFGDGF